MSGVELDLACPEIDVDDFSSVSKSNQHENVFAEDDQILESNDEITSLELTNVNNLETQISSNDNNITTTDHYSNEESIDSQSNQMQTRITQENEQYKSTLTNTIQTPIEVQSIPIHDEKQTGALQNIFHDTVYFLIKSGNEENVSLAKAKGVWSTPPANENKLNRAFRQHRNVILIFSVAESKAFQGFARMSCEARHDSQPINWVLPPGMSNRAFSGVIYIDWISRRSLPFNQTLHLFNSWNENKPVKIGRDGQEIEPRCAETLCRLFPSDPTIDILSISRKADKHKSSSRSPLSINPSKDINHRSSTSIDRHRRHRSRSRERNSKELHRKRRHRSKTRYADRYHSMGNKNTSPHLTKTLSINEHHEKNHFNQKYNITNNEDIDSNFDNSSYQSYNGKKKYGPSPRFRRRHTKQIRHDKKGKKIQVIDIIARGAFGNVIKVCSIHDQQIYAMKIMSKSQIVKDNAVQQVKDEVTIAQSCLSHPFIVHTYCYWQSRRYLYIITSYVENGELLSLWLRIRRFPEIIVKIYIAQVAMVLDYLHHKDIIYRDVKMENILLDEKGNIQIIDFGLSKWLSLGQRTTTICGTLQYIAPEVLSVRPYDHRVDWWSLGILMYACLFGEYPVSATKDHLSMANKVLNHKFNLPLNELENKTDVKELLYNLLEKNPNRRLCSLDELRQTSFMSNINFDHIYSKTYSPLLILMNAKHEWHDELTKHYYYCKKTRINTNGNLYYPSPSCQNRNQYENIDNHLFSA
ncbi:unnamed protein product [Rotaria sp. Silwood1]|nr:unnamed protein product [Rotaria sp. Silwood1]